MRVLNKFQQKKVTPILEKEKTIKFFLILKSCGLHRNITCLIVWTLSDS